MSGQDFDTLLRSPLDDERERFGVGYVLIGMGVGAAVTILLLIPLLG